jgi:dTDP-4-amino-4,6-dideoxygalactose transaminase
MAIIDPMDVIPFNSPYVTGKEISYINQVLLDKELAGGGVFTDRCQEFLESKLDVKKVLLTHSCTAALEMAAMLLDIQPGDEIIMPSYTFVSTANAFVIRGGVPVFVDIRKDTLNIDERLIEMAITPRTKAILPVHYAGVACEMDTIMDIANRHNLLVVEDAAQAIESNYKGRALGSIGDLGCLSFHETKNITSGEGGAILINNSNFIEQAEIIREKGTNRNRFLRGQVDKYSWVGVGSSYLPSEITAAFLYAQLEETEKITQERIKIWNNYDYAFRSLGETEGLSLPNIPNQCKHNAHIYYLILHNSGDRNRFIKYMNKNNIDCYFHYVPLHLSVAGRKYGNIPMSLNITEHYADCIVRLPLWFGLSEKQQEKVINVALEGISKGI